MEFDLSWILLGLPLAFALGWVASRLDLRQLRIENQQAPKAYFKGLNYLLNEQQGKAIDAFIEAVQNDPDTCELHFALGNLFRRRGEYERAVRVHQHLLSRGDLGRADRERAQHALALDFLKAGLLDRAEQALRKLDDTPFQTQAQLALLAIYERSRDWEQAAHIAEKLQAAGQGNFNGRLAHYLCEQVAALMAEGHTESARALLERATTTAPQAARPRMELAALQRTMGESAAAFNALQTLVQTSPVATPLVAQSLAELAIELGQEAQGLALLEHSYAQTPCLDILHALVRLQTHQGDALARARYVKHLEHEPSLVAAAHWLSAEKLEQEQFHPQVQKALDHAAKPLTRYRCAACGFEATQHFWQCPGCQTWDSFPTRRVEEL